MLTFNCVEFLFSYQQKENECLRHIVACFFVTIRQICQRFNICYFNSLSYDIANNISIISNTYVSGVSNEYRAL